MKGGTEMNNKMLYELCETLNKELEEVFKETTQKGMNSTYLDYIDKLTHSLKSVKTIIAMEESKGGNYGNGGGYNGYNRYYANPNSVDYNRGGYGYDGGYGEGDGYGRRGRDSMGRYTSDGDLAQELQKLIGQAPTPQIRMDMEHLAQKINNAM